MQSIEPTTARSPTHPCPKEDPNELRITQPYLFLFVGWGVYGWGGVGLYDQWTPKSCNTEIGWLFFPLSEASILEHGHIPIHRLLLQAMTDII